MSQITASERREIARQMEVHEQYLYLVLTRRRKAPMERCPDIERLTGGRETCEALRPDVCWVRLPDAAWPWHSNGRPLIDVTAANAAHATVKRVA